MEDKKLDEKESLIIITEMIKNARTNLRAKINCNTLLIWGYTTVIISFLVWFLKKNSYISWSSLLWLLIPLICIPTTLYLHSKDKTKITSYIDKSIFNITILFALVCTTTALSTIIVDFPILFIEQLLISMMIVIVGALINYKPIIWGGITGIIAAHILLFIPDMVSQIPIFAATFILSIIIPGHIFKKSTSSHV
ncbi:magnesium-transporting ATPase (P-type) [Dysgonomonas sp. PFB1-18]|uniref:hypothetical protein n=1 Tax=unclassified Dysgonomonas TaxID=2630389 RepID=UPI0024747054|nr:MULTISPECIES: hypothetical protein [unclassified Dysgonomonas]MDH6309420.1 magnesium-transporting ATPase (P-type) [Dysgonomonas sp. PF1-14]MDH6339715.1 magnesium-transporting ATPase (P-type) [Dysgonomonas sp. PF1-16]MDH6381363.1 magnesium-transporting ATPase (P-type) [Dysgonomonas sp. PFB1-18]MDH6398578.1 magnesium-transporting ATPase (P-type) [Dysgonomonas sp. PF1-23]